MFESFLNKHRERVVGLDILRSAAILIVVFEHGINMFPIQNHETYKSINPFKLDGVSVFFVLSGFLIGGILLRTISETNFTRKDLLNFWIRRWFRTVPNYLFVLLGLLAYNIIFLKSVGEFNWKYLFFSQNIASAHPNFFPEAWSLTVEEWFYLLFPIFCFVIHKFSKNKTTSILTSALIFLILPFIFRILKYESGIWINDIDAEFRKIIVLRLDSLMYGVIGAYIVFKNPEFWNKGKYTFLAIGTILILLLKLDPENWKNAYPPFIFNIESITTFCFLPFLSGLKTTKRNGLDVFFIFISIISYSMYLLNQTPVKGLLIPILTGILRKANCSEEAIMSINFIAFWLMTIIGSYVLYRFFENPMTKLRDRIKIG